MTSPVVLDAEGLDALCDPRPPEQFRALLHEAWIRERDVLVPAVVCAEACRGVARTRRVEAAVARQGPGRAQQPPLSVVVSDLTFARQVGAVLHGASADSRDMVDAHVVAVCALNGGGLVVTSDGDDINRLAQAVPAARVLTRRRQYKNLAARWHEWDEVVSVCRRLATTMVAGWDEPGVPQPRRLAGGSG